MAVVNMMTDFCEEKSGCKHPLSFEVLDIAGCRYDKQWRVGVENHLGGQSGIEETGENVAPTCGHGQKVDFLSLDKGWELIEEILLLLDEREADFIPFVMFFEIVFHSRQPYIVPHITL